MSGQKAPRPWSSPRSDREALWTPSVASKMCHGSGKIHCLTWLILLGLSWFFKCVLLAFIRHPENKNIKSQLSEYKSEMNVNANVFIVI